MQEYEYLAVPSPLRTQKVKGLKTPAERHAHMLTVLLNDLAREGWEYWRAESLPCEERKGLTGTATYTHAMLIFRRPSADALAEQMIVQDAPQKRADPSLSLSPDYRGHDDGPRLAAPAADRAVHDFRQEPRFRQGQPEDPPRG